MATRVMRVLDDAIAGHVALKSIVVAPGGGLELRGLEISDPEGHLVLSVGRARVAVDVTGLRRRAIGVSVELDAPSVMLEEERGGGLSIARAFAPSHPGAPAPEGDRGGGGGWTLYLTKLAIRQGDVWWVDARGGTRLQASGLDVDARGLWGPRRARAELRLRGGLDAPVAAPLALELAGGLTGDAVRVPVLTAQLGKTVVAAVGEGDLARRTGRVALLRADLGRELARAVDSKVPRGDDLDAAAYAESDGATLTAAIRAEPAGAGPPGRADAALALRLAGPARAVGFDVALDRLDPSRLAAEAPKGEITLQARGAVAGRTLGELRGRVEARLQRSTLRRGEIRSAELVARADRGTVDVSRATLSAPGVSLDGTARWKPGGTLGGRVVVDATDLAELGRNVNALLGTPRPPVSGRARVDAALGGTPDAPTASLAIDAPQVRVGSFAFSGARLGGEGSGPLRDPTIRIEGHLAAVRSSGTDVARGVSLRGALTGGDGSVDATASLPGFEEPARLEGRGRLSPARDAVDLSTLALSYPGARWALAAPAAVTFEGPTVDRLELASGSQRVIVTGGLGPRGALDAHAVVTRLDLAHLPAPRFTERNALRGELSADVRATGTAAQPAVAASFTLAGAAIRGVEGIAATGTATWNGAARRATASASLSQRGATLDVGADLPLPLAGRPGEPLRASVRGRALPLPELFALARVELDAAGSLSLDAAVEGTVGAPALRVSAALDDGRWEELGGIGLRLTAEDGGERLAASLRAAQGGAAVANARAEVPLVLSDLLVRAPEALRRLRAAPIAGSAEITGLELASIAGRAGVPEGLAGRADGTATVSGTLAQPRAEATLDVSQGAWAGYRDVGVHLALSLAGGSTSATGRIALSGDEAARFGASLDLPPERLGSAAAIRKAPLRAEVVVPRISLERTGPRDLPLTGAVSGKLAVSGTPGAPEATLLLDGTEVAVRGRPLGKAHLEARYARARASGELVLTPPAGGPLHATAALQADLGLGARQAPLREAAAEVNVDARGFDLAALAALVPTLVRSSAGTLDADLSARGTVGQLQPGGTVRVRDGRVAIVEYGELSGIALDARASADAIEVTKLEVRRGRGKVDGSVALRGLGKQKRLDGRLDATSFTVARAGMEVATVDVRADLGGSWDGKTLSADITVPRGTIRLPKRSPRPLQPLDDRKDIVVSRPEDKQESARPRGAREVATLLVHVLVPRGFFVKGEDPRIDVELKADVTYEQTGPDEYVRGYVETVRGTVEPIAGRTFSLQKGRVQFTGGPPMAATLDVEARYENPAAVVTAKITGPIQKPDINLSSQPVMDEAQIALLIATGQRELKAGTGAVGTMTGAEAGRAALGAVATTAFRSLVANKLPIDTIAVESGSIRAGTYVTDKIYVGYVKRFEADPNRRENPDEVRVEYQITPRWNFESRYGTAQSGGASLIWSKDF